MATNESSPDDGETGIDDGLDTSPEADQASFKGRSIRSIASNFLSQPPGTRLGASQGPARSTKAIVEGLDRQEMTLAITATVLDFVFTLIAYFVAWRHSSVLATRQDADSFLLAGLVGSALLLIGTIFRRRALLGFASFIVGFEMVQGYHQSQGILYVAFGAWLLVRALRKQKQNQSRATSKPTSAMTTSRSTSRPSASKRYTPPRRSRTVTTKKR